jgi:hypothetical protein
MEGDIGRGKGSGILAFCHGLPTFAKRDLFYSRHKKAPIKEARNTTRLSTTS